MTGTVVLVAAVTVAVVVVAVVVAVVAVVVAPFGNRSRGIYNCMGGAVRWGWVRRDHPHLVNQLGILQLQCVDLGTGG